MEYQDLFEVYLKSLKNMFAANPRFARGASGVSFDMLKSLLGLNLFIFHNNKP